MKFWSRMLSEIASMVGNLTSKIRAQHDIESYMGSFFTAQMPCYEEENQYTAFFADQSKY